MELRFDWDELKAAGNYRKHGVRFQEVATVFHDPLSITIHNPDHSTGEQRYIAIGTSEGGGVSLCANGGLNHLFYWLGQPVFRRRICIHNDPSPLPNSDRSLRRHLPPSLGSRSDLRDVHNPWRRNP